MGKKLVDPNRLCIGCMEILEDPSKPCPKCHFLLRDYRPPANSIPPYEILHGKYMVGRVIGEGGFGITYIGWDFYQGKRICIKEYFPRGLASREQSGSFSGDYSTTCSVDVMTQNTVQAQNAYSEGLKSYIREAEHLSRFFLMSGIVSVRDFFYGHRTAYIVMEYIDGINLKELAGRNGGVLPPDVLFPLVQDVVRALYAVHQEGIVHGDISPDNIMITKKFQAKLIDFGAAQEYRAAGDHAVLLKHGYAPVEQYGKQGDMGAWTDVYSLCATLYYLLSRTKVQRAYERLNDDRVLPLRALGVNVTKQQEAAIQKGLGVQIADRYQSMADLYEALYQEKITGSGMSGL